MNRLQQFRHLHWPRFLGVFVVVDVCALVLPLWELALRMTGPPGNSTALENLRQLQVDAQQELRDLLDEAASCAD